MSDITKVDTLGELGTNGKKYLNAVLKAKEAFTTASDKYFTKVCRFLAGCEIDKVFMIQEKAAVLIGCDRSYISKLRKAILKAVDAKDTTMVAAHELVHKMGVVKFLDKYTPPRIAPGESDTDSTGDGESTENGEAGDNVTLPDTATFMASARQYQIALETGQAVPTPEQAETLAIQLMEIVDSIAEHQSTSDSDSDQAEAVAH